MFPASILERGDASTILTAIEGNYADLTRETIKKMARESDVFVLDELPDGCKPSKREKSSLVHTFEDDDRVLIDEHYTCCVHTLHNRVTKAIDEKGFVGHLHAVQSVLNIQGRRNQLLSA